MESGWAAYSEASAENSAIAQNGKSRSEDAIAIRTRQIHCSRPPSRSDCASNLRAGAKSLNLSAGGRIQRQVALFAAYPLSSRSGTDDQST